ncbi:bifunctional diguanylate cyclase/phosphodiesterase [Clostridiales bacterium COT073_COT-073]|nr:bifunctional diguanylate cyclase/phosphodiesterase [Clostridiales bacterium COT073_COT-073]
MENHNAKTKLFISIYFSLMILYIIAYLTNMAVLRDTCLTLSTFSLCWLSLYALKTTHTFHRLLFWIVSFFWMDFLCRLFYILASGDYVKFAPWVFALMDVIFSLPSLILLIICLEILYLIRERLNSRFLLINMAGITFFFTVMAWGIVSFRFDSMMHHFYSPFSLFPYLLDILCLILLISILSSLIHDQLHNSVFLTLMGIALFCTADIAFLIVDVFYTDQVPIITWILISAAISLLLIFSLFKLINSSGHFIHHSIQQQTNKNEPIALSKTKIHSLLFVLSCFCLLCQIVDFAIFSYMNLALLIYFLGSNSYLISYQNQQYVKKQRVLNNELEEKVKQRNIAILKQNIKLQDLANRDLLTNAYNRRHFQEVITGLNENARLFAVDILQFSNINQVFGEAIGDRVLIHLYKILHQAFPAQSIFRVDSNEYVILFRSPKDNSEDICQRIFETVKLPFVSEFYTIPLDICIGVADYCGLCVEDKPENLLIKANFALNEVKSSNIIPPMLYFDQNLADKKYRYGLIQSLLDSINFDEEFQLYYQPQYTADGSTLIGAEALLRWFSPKLGAVSPGEFIPIAEESPTIIKIVDWTLKKACRQISEWNKIYGKQLKIGVNVSPKYIERPYFYENLEALTQYEDWNLGSIDLEITETSIMHLDLSVTELFQKLSDMGISTSIDDFGTGYSSLSYIKNLKISTLKIAKELIDSLSQDSSDELIINAIIKMAQGLHIKTIAEGIETREQAAILQRLGCDYIQGYYFGRPVPPEEFVKMHL